MKIQETGLSLVYRVEAQIVLSINVIGIDEWLKKQENVCVSLHVFSIKMRDDMIINLRV